MRPAGWISRSASSACPSPSNPAKSIGVSIAAGANVTTRISGPRSTARARVRPWSAALLVAYAANFGFVARACTLPILITRPLLRRSLFTKHWIRTKGAVRLTWIVSFQASHSKSSVRPNRWTAALLINKGRSRSPTASWIWRKSGVARSSPWARVAKFPATWTEQLPSGGVIVSMPTTCRPDDTRALPIAAPMPPATPVRIAADTVTLGPCRESQT